MSTRPRTPENFPRMKDRAQGRRLRKAARYMDALGGYSAFCLTLAQQAAFVDLAMRQLTDAMASIVWPLAQTFPRPEWHKEYPALRGITPGPAITDETYHLQDPTTPTKES